MLKLRNFDPFEQRQLFTMMSDPAVFPYVRHKATSYEEFVEVNAWTIEAEGRGELISRVIMNEENQPAGIINLFDIANNSGFIATWLGTAHQGKGLNQVAKKEFLHEVFTTTTIESVYMCIRQTNIRSQKAARKLPYVVTANEEGWARFAALRDDYASFELLEIPKALFHAYEVGALERAAAFEAMSCEVLYA